MAKESFADLFARGDVPVGRAKAAPVLRVGHEVEGVVAHITKDAVFIDLDEKQQGFFESIDFVDAQGTMLVKTGDRVKGYVVQNDGGQVKLGKKIAKGEVSTEHLRAAFEGGMAIEGKITGVNKGGVEIELGGGVRGFCPASQLDDHFVEDTSTYIGKTLAFVITKLEGKNVVVSRRALLTKQNAEARERALANVAIGATMKGRVTQVREFGAFVDLGGIEGLVPTRELSHDRVRVEDAVQVGDVLEVQVKGIEKKKDAKGREKLEVTLSVKALAGDPWSGIEVVAPVGRVVAGQVTRLADFGAFVRLASGIEGLLHVSELGARVKTPADALAIGQPVLVRVLSVDSDKRRVGLALASDGAAVGSMDRGASIVVGQIVKATVERIEHFGLIVQIVGAKGRSGRAVVPNAETATRPGADLRKDFPQGLEITAKVLEAGDRTRISIKAAHEDAERADFDAFRASQGSAGMGTFGDLLKNKLKKS